MNAKILSILKDRVAPNWTKSLIVFVLFIVDCQLNMPLYTLVLELPIQFAVLLSLCMSVVYAVIAWICGKLIARNDVGLALTFFALFLLLMVGTFYGQSVATDIQAEDPLTLLLEEEQPGSDEHSLTSKRHYVAVGLTLVLFLLAVFISFLIARADEAVKDTKRKLKQGALLSSLQGETDILQGQHDRDEARKWAKAESNVQARKEEHRSNMNRYERKVENLNGARNFQLSHLDIIENQTISVINAVLDKQNAFQKLMSGMKKVFTNSRKLTATLFIVMVSIAITPANANQHNINLTRQYNPEVATMSTVMTPVKTEQYNLAYVLDISGSNSTIEFDPKAAFQYLIGMVDIKDPKTGINAYTTTIGEFGVPKVNIASLPRSKGRFTPPSVRKRHLSTFIRKGLADFEKLDQVANDKRTEILRSLVALVDQLEPNADRTILIIESDFISSGYVANFIKYQNRLPDLEKNFDKIIAAFKKDNELPDLSGFEVVMRTTGNSELALWSVRWWKKALYEFGAKDVKVEAAY